MVTLEPRVLIENAIYYGAGAYALWKGDGWVKTATAAVLIENTLTFLIDGAEHVEDPRYVSLTLDGIVLTLLLVVAFRTNFRWPLLASALQILSTLTFIARMIDPTIHSYAYVTVDIGLSFGVMATLVFAAFTRRRDRREAVVPHHERYG